jgi:hypothetical protein
VGLNIDIIALNVRDRYSCVKASLVGGGGVSKGQNAIGYDISLNSRGYRISLVVLQDKPIVVQFLDRRRGRGKPTHEE